MQRFSRDIPWVLVAQTGPGAFLAECEVCRARASGGQPGVAAFAEAHRAHTAGPGAFGLGDAVAAVAKPVARMLGRAPCTPCEARRRALNAARLW